MVSSKLRILFCVSVAVAMLAAPLALDIFPDGNVYAKSEKVKLEKIAKVKVKPPSTKIKTPKLKGRNISKVRINGERNGIPQVPEPSTMLLLGLGLIGIVSLRKKFK